MKHLNPRQGITTATRPPSVVGALYATRVKHLNPRQGITTWSIDNILGARCLFRGVKHLNPRQGITTEPAGHTEDEGGEV